MGMLLVWGPSITGENWRFWACTKTQLYLQQFFMAANFRFCLYSLKFRGNTYPKYLNVLSNYRYFNLLKSLCSNPTGIHPSGIDIQFMKRHIWFLTLATSWMPLTG